MGTKKNTEGSDIYEVQGGRNTKRKVAIGGLLLVVLMYWSPTCLLQLNHGLQHTVPVPHTDRIEWAACGDGVECGRLLVPLNYHDLTQGHANLSVGRLPAKNRTARLGSIFVNPGGPGGSGLGFLYRAGPALAELLDNRYDVVSWDPRGINGTTPRVECYESQTAQDIAFSHTYLGIGLEARNLSDPIDRAVYTQQVRKTYSENAVIGELCFNKSGEVLRHVGTATVVRDLELLSRVIDGPGKPVNYWGFSYGTVIGSYFVNMFPHRVGRFAIDGVVDPIVWTTKNSYEVNQRFLVDIEQTYTNFLEACANAGPARCALHTNETPTSTAIREAVDKLIDDLYGRPLPVPFGKQPYILTSGMARNIIFANMYSPRTWIRLAEQLAAAMRGDGAPITDVLITTIELDTTVQEKTTLATPAVICVDGPEIQKVDADQAVEDIVEAIVLTYEKVSRHFSANDVFSCHHLKVREVERFVGPFNHTGLANDILIIGNTADPVTPLASARLVNQLLPQSRLVIQDGSGHCSLAMASPCTGRAIRGYFLNGELPPNGIVCDTVEKLFHETSDATTEAKSWLKDGMNVSKEDARLAEQLRKLGQAVEPFLGLHRNPKRLL